MEAEGGSVKVSEEALYENRDGSRATLGDLQVSLIYGVLVTTTSHIIIWKCSLNITLTFVIILIFKFI